MARTYFRASTPFNGHDSVALAIRRFNDIAEGFGGYSWGGDPDTGTIWFDGTVDDNYDEATRRFNQDLRAADLTANAN